jgi:hypothetical protein
MFTSKIDSLKNSLTILERQFGTIGSSLSFVGVGGAVNINNPQTEQERAFFERQQRLLSTQVIQEKQLAQEQINTQKELINQLKETSSFNRSLFGDVTEDLAETKRNLLDASSIIGRLLPFAEARVRPLSRGGNFPKQYTYAEEFPFERTGVNPEWLEAMKPVLDPMSEAYSLGQRLAQDPQTKEGIQDYIKVINNTIKRVADQVSVEPAQVEEMLEIIKPSVVSTKKALPQVFQSLQTETTQKRLAPFGGVIEKEQMDLSKLAELSALTERKNFFVLSAKEEKRLSELQGLQTQITPKEPVKQKEETLEELEKTIQSLKEGDKPVETGPRRTPELELPTILNALQQEQEKRRITGVGGDIRSIIEPELELDEKIKNRGFITGVEKRAMRFQQKAREIGEGIQESAKEGLTGFMTKERSLFGRKFRFGESAEEFIERRQTAREEAIERINNKYVININNPVVRTDEDIQQMKRELRAALSGL